MAKKELISKEMETIRLSMTTPIWFKESAQSGVEIYKIYHKGKLIDIKLSHLKASAATKTMILKEIEKKKNK